MTIDKTHRYLPGRMAAALLTAGLLSASCTENGPPKSNLNQQAIVPEGITLTQATPGAVSVNEVGNVGGSPAAAPVPKPELPKEEIVVPPKDAQWTILCAVIGGPGHTMRARHLKSQLIEATKSNKWYVVLEEEKSTIYYGFYRSIDRGTKDGDAAQADHQQIARMPNASGEMPMRLCTFMRIDRAAPDAPAEWDLNTYTRNPKQFWSLQIAAYTADASDELGHDRKWAAVESVKDLRAQGVPAYFAHGETVSSVCIGIWPETSIKKQAGGNLKGNAGAENPEQSIFVSTDPLPEGVTPRDSQGRAMKTVVPRVEILDPDLYAWIKKYPAHAINAIEHFHEVLDPTTKQKREVAEPSFLVLLPEEKQSATMSGAPRPPVDTGPLPTLPPALLQIDTMQQTGTHKLREIGQ